MREADAEGDELFERANLFPRTTGLAMTVWVSPRGNQINVANAAVVAGRPTPHVIAGHLSPDDRRAVFEWVSLNATALVAYGEGRIDTIELGQQLQRLPSRPPGAPAAP